MHTSLVFRPTMVAGIVYAREVGSVGPLAPIGGIAELTLSIDEQKITQPNRASSGGGNRATVYRINELTMSAQLQDLNPVNLARSLRSRVEAVTAGTVTDEARTAQAGGLMRLTHLQPSTVVIRNATTDAAIAAAGNWEARPEGIWWYDNSTALAAAKTAWVTANPSLDPDDFPGLGVEVDYAHSGYDVIEALTAAAPVLEMSFAGVNEAADDAPQTVDLYQVKLSATKGLGLISAGEFAVLDIEGEVLRDPTKTGVGTSKYFRKRMYRPPVA